MGNNIVSIRSSSVEETRAAGARLARIAAAGDVYCLDGDLGCGKTEFVRGFAGALLPGGNVRSPTFSIVNVYPAEDFPIFHFDFYRIEDEREFVSIGLDEYIYGCGVCLIEWGTLYPNVLPDYAKRIRFHAGEGSVRIIESDILF